MVSPDPGEVVTMTSSTCGIDPANIARTLGGEAVGGQVLCPEPAGHSPGDRSLSVAFSAAAPAGFGRDGWRRCRDDVGERRVLRNQRRGRSSERCDAKSHERPLARRDRRALWFWSQRRPILRSIDKCYLREARGYLGPIASTLSFLPARGEHGPALIVAHGFASEPEPGTLAIAEKNVGAVHLTRLAANSHGRIDTITAWRGAAGSPMVFAPCNDALGLATTERIEGGLSIFAATGPGVWAAGSAGQMAFCGRPVMADRRTAALDLRFDHLEEISDRALSYCRSIQTAAAKREPVATTLYCGQVRAVTRDALLPCFWLGIGDRDPDPDAGAA
jgi:hypothetical protein